MAARACPAVAGVSETGRVPPGMHDGVWSGSGGFSWGTVRLGICLFVSIWHLGRFSGCVGVPEGSPDCVCWYWFSWSRRGRGVLAVGGICAAVVRRGWQMGYLFMVYTL